MLVPLSAPFSVVEYSLQTLFRLKMSYVGWYGVLHALRIEDFNEGRQVLPMETNVQKDYAVLHP
jgi:hypothetical protein